MNNLKIKHIIILLSLFSFFPLLFAENNDELIPDAVNTEHMVSKQYGNDIYRLGRGDVIQILVRGKSEFSGSFVIGPDGRIQYPFISDITADGLSKEELQNTLKGLLTKYIKTPEVSVQITSYKSKYIYILGEVKNPGKYFIAGDEIALRDAIIEAGLPTYDAALKKVRVIYPSNDEHPVSKKINLKKILYKGKLKENLMLHPGDLVVVPSLLHSKINRFLNKLLDPLTRVSIIDAMVERHED